MMTRNDLMRHVGALLFVGAATATLAAGVGVPYPDGYRDWTHVKSMVIEDGHPLYESFGGIHHLYANDTAMAGYRSGSFPEGSVIVFDLLEAVSADATLSEGARKVLGVMVRDSAAYSETGGWGYEGWAGGDPSQPVVGAAAAEACYACHTAVEETGFVFSAYRE
ncbi:cytochrome P460 family protein [Roseovarius autotrophicus]|uniref:cytochrome P460 family protein n=1 Tax=Roseovarius autotrophicus TaxID=2824121 RepID=UPI001B38CBDE|nr:cytochrome P460 family protein [Roseovarius autotrophicus]